MTRPVTYYDLHDYGSIFDSDEELAAHRKTFQNALQRLRAMLDDPDREYDTMYGPLHYLWMGVAVVQREDIPLLAEITLVARERGGTGAHDTEERALQALLAVSEKSELPFWVETFEYTKPRDSFAGRRRKVALQAAAVLALLQESEPAMKLLLEGLAHRKERTREDACEVIQEIVELGDFELPAELEQKIAEIASTDKSHNVRAAAGRLLDTN